MDNSSPSFHGSNDKGVIVVGIIGIVILVLATLIYAWQNNSGMATATATMVLVIITAFYAWNTHLQVRSMSEQADLIRRQANNTRKGRSATTR